MNVYVHMCMNVNQSAFIIFDLLFLSFFRGGLGN